MAYIIKLTETTYLRDGRPVTDKNQAVRYERYLGNMILNAQKGTHPDARLIQV